MSKKQLNYKHRIIKYNIIVHNARITRKSYIARQSSMVIAQKNKNVYQTSGLKKHWFFNARVDGLLVDV